MDKKKQDFILYTNAQLNSCRDEASLNQDKEHTMWLNLNQPISRTKNRITLHPVKSDRDYEEMFLLRKNIEKEFGITDLFQIKKIVNSVRKMTNRYDGRWYLAKLEGISIGEIGLVPFNFDGEKIGRLKDINILKDFHGNGFDRELIEAISLQSIDQDYKALCLMAKETDCPKDFYSNLGFKIVGTT